MKKALLLLFLFLFLASTVHGDEASLNRAMELYRKHHYQDAARLLYQLPPDKNPTRHSKIRLGFGMAALANTQCYRELYGAAKSVQTDHLHRLVKSDKKEQRTSKLAALYLAKAYIETHEPTAAANLLERFLKVRDVDPYARNQALAALGTVYYLAGEKNKARKRWAQIPDDLPETAILLAAAFSQTGISIQQPEKMADQALGRILEKQVPLTVSSASALLDIYTRQKKLDKGFKVLAHTDSGAFAHEEIISDNKVIRFYELSLFDHMATFYARASVDALEEASTSNDKNVRSTALFYLSEAYALLNRDDKVRDAIGRFLSVKQPPLAYQRARVRQTAYHDLVHHPKAPDDPFKPYLTKDTDPSILSEIMWVCSQQHLTCTTAVDQAGAIWQQATGKPPVKLSTALGRYYRNQNAYAKALSFLEAARDKSRKNRIEANSPLLLIDLARAYYHTRHFSEALEIYFEMSRQFPAVRQIQASLQGVYAMEQQSAGDAKIF